MSRSWLARKSDASRREPENPGIGERVERFLIAVLKRVKERTNS